MLSLEEQVYSEPTSQINMDTDNSKGLGISKPNYFIQISGEVETQNYRTILSGGSKYTVYFEYEKMGYSTEGEDTFTINSVNIRRAITPQTVVETNENGEITTELLFGKYLIKEIEAPDGYILNDESFEIDFQAIEMGQNPEEVHTILVENTKKSKVTVHYYKLEEKDNPTPEALIEDLVLMGNPDEPYTTEIIKEFEKDGIEYELENTLSEDGTKTYVIPDNSTGKFKLGEDQEVIYYYVEKKTPLIVHHYIQGTAVGVPLADGTSAKDERFSGKEGEEYTTDALTAEELSEEYELVEAPANSTGTYGKDEIVVTYYYKKIGKNVSIFKYDLQKQINQETGLEEEVKVPLAGAEFTILRTDVAENTTDAESRIRDIDVATEMVGYSAENIDNSKYTLEQSSKATLPSRELQKYTTDENGKIDVKLEVGEYEIAEVKAPEGYILPEGEAAKTTIIVNRETEDGQLIEIENNKPQGTVIVKHLQLDENGNPTEIPVQIKDGENLVDAPIETKTGDIGSEYATKPVENLPINWKYVKAEGETSGTFKESEITVIYYYQQVDFEETIDIELTKIWKDNSIQALRRPKRIKFIVTPYVETEEQTLTEASQEQPISNPDGTNTTPDVVEDIVNTEPKLEEQKSTSEITGNETNKTSENIAETAKEETLEKEIAEVGSTEKANSEKENSENITTEENVGNTDSQNTVNNTLNETSKNTTTQENTVSETPTANITEPEKVSSAPEKVTNTHDTIASENAENSEAQKVIVQELEVYEFTFDVEKGESYTYTLYSLPKYDKTTGKTKRYKITETYDEKEGSEHDLDFYTAQGGEVIELIDENGNIKYTSRIINTFTLPEDNSKDIKAIKVWKDRDNERKTRPESIILELVGRVKNIEIEEKEDGTKVLNVPETAERKLDSESANVEIPNTNPYEHTFSKSKYDADGQEIEYSVDEKEKTEGSLKKYNKTITSNEDKSEFTIINSLNVQGSSITKIGSEKLRAKDGKVNYTIDYVAELDTNYEDENIQVTIVDKLPYKISEKERNIAGGTYDEESKTITWTGTYNTKSEEQVVLWSDGSKTPVTLNEEKQVKVLEFKKDISFSYIGITLDIETIVNNVSGKIQLRDSEETVTALCETKTEWKQDVIVNKLWNGDTESTRPDSIDVELKLVKQDENGNQILEDIKGFNTTITPTATADGKTVWTYTYKDLPRYDAEGNEYKYTVDETGVNYTKGEQTVENEYYCEKSEEVVDSNTVITLTNNKFGSITVTKVDSRKEDVKLQGAEFKLEKLIQDESGNWVVPEETSEDYSCATGTTTEDGTYIFENLKYGFYKLTEIKAPEDYRISKEELELIEVRAGNTDVQLTVKNDKKYSLPTTGGLGIDIIRNAGILIVSIFAIILTNRKKIVPVKRSKIIEKPARRKK